MLPDDATVNDTLLAALRAELVALFGAVLHEGVAKRLHGRRLAGGILGRSGVAALAHVGQPLLRDCACLIDHRFPLLAQGGLAALISVRAELESS